MIHIVIHVLPQEIDQLEQLLVHLKKSSIYLNSDDYFVDVVLNTKLIDWSLSKLNEEFFINKFSYLETLTTSWCKANFEISNGSILGCNDIRRRALRTSTADYIMYLDADNIFSDTLLYNIKQYCDELLKQDGYSILVPQTTRLWDSTWDIITNKLYLETDASHNNYFNRDPYTLNRPEDVYAVEVNCFKFAGWGTCIPTKIRDIIDIPDSLGSYGLDDTFIMSACTILKQKQVNIKQYVLEGEIIIENNKFRFNPYKDYLTVIDYREKFLNNAQTAFNVEIQKYLQ